MLQISAVIIVSDLRAVGLIRLFVEGFGLIQFSDLCDWLLINERTRPIANAVPILFIRMLIINLKLISNRGFGFYSS